MRSLLGSPSHAQFFGLDLASFLSDVVTAWCGMLDWPVLSWLRPKLKVRLWLPEGTPVLTRGLQATMLNDHASTQSARFEAILLPESLLLRRTIHVPKLRPADIQAALALEIQTLSPFTPDDTVWACEITPTRTASLKVDLLLTARKLVNQHVATLRPQLTSQAPEVWATRASGAGFVMMPGFGDTRRQRQGVLWRWASAILGLLALALIGTMAVTPSLQLYLRSLQAQQAMVSLKQKAEPVIAQRESLLHTIEHIDALAKLIGNTVPTLQVLNLITTALSDDTSLLSLKIQGSKVTLSGQTVNASVLMKQLGSTPGLKDVKAPTPAVKPLGATRESFTIEFTLDPAQRSDRT